jgi:hypothetical protein
MGAFRLSISSARFASSAVEHGTMRVSRRWPTHGFDYPSIRHDLAWLADGREAPLFSRLLGKQVCHADWIAAHPCAGS